MCILYYNFGIIYRSFGDIRGEQKYTFFMSHLWNQPQCQIKLPGNV